jgi:hypothetical protein
VKVGLSHVKDESIYISFPQSFQQTSFHPAGFHALVSMTVGSILDVATFNIIEVHKSNPIPSESQHAQERKIIPVPTPTD